MGLPDWAGEGESGGLGKQVTTHNLFTLLHAGLDLGHISLGVIVDGVDLVFTEDLEGLFGGQFPLPKAR